MGTEISSYHDRVVAALQTAYGTEWNITARGESAELEDKAWQVQVGFFDFNPERNGDGGIDLVMTSVATVNYTGKGPTHNSGQQAADITASLLAWLGAYVDPMDNTTGFNFDMDMQVEARGEGPVLASGRWRGLVFWDVRLYVINPDIDIAGYTTGHPSRRPEVYEDFGLNLADVDINISEEYV